MARMAKLHERTRLDSSLQRMMKCFSKIKRRRRRGEGIRHVSEWRLELGIDTRIREQVARDLASLSQIKQVPTWTCLWIQ